VAATEAAVAMVMATGEVNSSNSNSSTIVISKIRKQAISASLSE
jgi:hypothetical protein